MVTTMVSVPQRPNGTIRRLRAGIPRRSILDVEVPHIPLRYVIHASKSSKIMKHMHYCTSWVVLIKTSLSFSVEYGFRAGLSCNTKVLECYHNLDCAFDKSQTYCRFLDFRKAFDVINHSFFLHKIRCLNIDANIFWRIVNYIDSRKQRVIIDGDHSSYVELTSRVSEGSVLDPLLFLIFNNGITHGFTSRIRL